MYLIDTNVVSELRKKKKANPGVQSFFKTAEQQASLLFLSVITVGELRRGVEKIRYRGDHIQAKQLETWLNTLIDEYQSRILDFGATDAQVWGKLRVPHYENAIDKQIAATAITYDLVVVTRNTDDFAGTGANVLNPFK
ncbi:type II toxin-antitoxin system VapC family toxin [Endozoicomonas elysicola]|uniref:Recombinase n=1 Tax=Endozoicomonas elysicola TaxID=305900 RepID=A0A081K9C5_9GAMM|nr:type II toxin-antitoxin system VapC family toxin [Endozoicomonas elysicola]KEI70751.1 recombinase [Endozoicomonas elysicola]